jgi:uncharacterized protein YcbX
MKVTDLYIYPIKSCQAIRLSQAEVTKKGFFGDREFMLVDREGNFLTQRQYPLLASIQVQLEKETLSLATANNQLPPLTFSPSLQGQEMKVKIWGDRTVAIDQGDEVAHWFNQALQLAGNSQCRLVRQSARYLRSVDPQYSPHPNQPVSFADGYPFLLTATASLAELNRRLRARYPEQEPQVPMNRFRPNIVVETALPFIEGTWKTIKLGLVDFSLVKPCSRCIITTTNQISGQRNQLKEPLATLSTFRQVKNQGIMFGENMIAQSLGIIKVGDRVEIVDY